MPGKKKSKSESPQPAPKPKRAASGKAPRKTAKPAVALGPSPAPQTKSTNKTTAATKAGASPPFFMGGNSWMKPARQGETRVVAFVRDPSCLFTYWEVTPQNLEAVKEQLTGEFPGSSMVLRVFKIASGGQEELIEEIKVGPGERNRYVELNDGGGSYIVEVAQKALSGRVVVYSRSNKVITFLPWFQAPSGAAWDAPAGLLEYFSETADSEPFTAPRGISSAEAHRKAGAGKRKGRGILPLPFDRPFHSRRSASCPGGM